MPWQRKEVSEVGVACFFSIHTEMDAIFQLIKKSDTYQIKLYMNIAKIFMKTAYSSFTPGIQKHGTMRKTVNDANLLGGNIKGGLFWCVHTSKGKHSSTADELYIHIEHYFEDRCTKFRI